MAQKLASVSFLANLDGSFTSADSVSSDEDYDSEFDDESDSSSSCCSLDDDDDLLLLLSGASESASTTHPTSHSSSNIVRRSNSLPSLSEIEMSSLQVSVMLNQLRCSNHCADHQDNRKSNIKKLEHIQGEAMDPVGLATVARCGVDPAVVFNEILTESRFDPRVISHDEVDNFFLDVTESRLASYSTDIIRAVRTGDVDFLRISHFEQKQNMTCCNRFGESIIHTACRHSQTKVVRFLIEEAKVTLRVVDDFGRNPCHDAAWQANPNMELVQLLVNHEPDLLLISDKRGFTPLQGIRKEWWPAWVKLLQTNRANILPKKLLKPRGSCTAGSA